MDDVLVDILQAIVAHASDEEPGADVWILVHCQRVLANTTSIDIESGKVARELASVLCNQTPFRELLLFRTLNVETTDFIPSELKPVHVVC